MNLSDFLPYVLPYAKGCPEIIVELNVRLAVIELCQKSMVWREYQDKINTVALQTAYEFDITSDMQVCSFISLTFGEDTLYPISADDGKELDAAGCIEPYVYGTFTGFELRPAQEAGLPIVTYCALAPSLSAITIPDSFSQYAEAIAQGALSRILVSKGRDYFDIAGASIAKSAWNEAIADAATDALKGFARSTVRTSKVWF